MSVRFSPYFYYPADIACTCGHKGIIRWEAEEDGKGDRNITRIEGNFFERVAPGDPRLIQLICSGCRTTHAETIRLGHTPWDTAHLSDAELLSLKAVRNGVGQRKIPARHAARLLELKLIYRLLGSFRVTPAGLVTLRERREAAYLEWRQAAALAKGQAAPPSRLREARPVSLQLLAIRVPNASGGLATGGRE